MKYFYSLFLLCAAMGVHAQSERMDSLIAATNHARETMLRRSSMRMNPYMYRLFAPATLYDQPVREAMQPVSTGEASVSTPVSNLAKAIDMQLARFYVMHPEMVPTTEQDIQQQTKLREGVQKPMEARGQLTEHVVAVDLGADVVEPVELVVEKPKFWTVNGEGGLQFAENYFSKNWYQGGEFYLSALLSASLDFNYDNKEKLQFDNRVEMQLGLQTTDDEVHKLRASTNLLRMTNKVGYKAAKNWFYTAALKTETQIVPNYEKDSKIINSAIGSPLDVNLSVGMDYKFENKSGKFKGSLYLAPVAYSMRYVYNDSLCAMRFGWAKRDDEDMYILKGGDVVKDGPDKNAKPEDDRYWGNYRLRHSTHDFGPSLTFKFTWEIFKNIFWDSRLWYYTSITTGKDNYHKVEFENKFTFTVNKYFSAQVYLYPRFDNSVKYKDWHGYEWKEECEPTPKVSRYFMFKQWLSVGVNYRF